MPPAYAPKEPDGIGVGKPPHPFAATVEAQVPVSPLGICFVVLELIPECNRTRWIWYQVPCLSYHHRGCIVGHGPTCQNDLLIHSLPTGTQLPGGAVLPMSSVADFPMVLPEGE